MMSYSRGDILTVSAKGNGGKPRPCVVVQADWLNEKNPPSYIVCLLTTDIYEELDFRPLIKPAKTNGLEKPSQVMTDKIQAVREIQIGKKIGYLDKKVIAEIDNALRSLVNL